MTRPQAKGLSLPFYAAWTDHPEHYNFERNRQRIDQDFTCDWVKFWINWAEVQPDPQSPDFAVHCDYMNHRPEIDRLDWAIKWANENGVFVMLTVDCFYPVWSSFQPGEPVHEEYLTGKSRYRRFPYNLDPAGPWDWFISYLYNRYRLFDAPNYHGRINPTGPRPGNWHGNPQGAWIGGLEIVNEPNQLPWPQNGVSCTVAKMMQTAEVAINYWNNDAGQLGQGWFAPATSQLDADSWRYQYPATQSGDKVQYSSAGGAMEQQILQILANWRPRQYVAWSTHDYKDMKETGVGHVRSTIQRLYDYNWRGGGDRDVWITEGGYEQKPLGDPTQASIQAQRIRDNWSYLAVLPEVALWTQHLIHNRPTNSFTSGLKYYDDYTGKPGLDNQWPAYATYQAL